MAQHILVIDDNEELRSIIKIALEDEGYTVETEEDVTALLAAHTRPPCLILLDLLMPMMNGFDMGRRLRADPVTASIPIIVMSAGREAQVGAEQMRAAGYLAKPFSLAQLDALVAPYALGDVRNHL